VVLQLTNEPNRLVEAWTDYNLLCSVWGSRSTSIDQLSHNQTQQQNWTTPNHFLLVSHVLVTHPQHGSQHGFMIKLLQEELWV
jgi:hypothetical protein